MLRFPAVTGRLAPYRFYLEPKVGGIGRQVVNNGCRNSAGAVVSALLVKVNLQPYRNERLDAKHLKLESDAVMLRAWVHGGPSERAVTAATLCTAAEHVDHVGHLVI
jgi:hypothetical protein